MGATWSLGGSTLKVGESQYAVCPALQKMVLEEKWETLLVQKTSPDFELIDVDLSLGTYSNPFRHEYRVATNSEIQSDCPMIVLFPHHPNEKKQVLWTSSFSNMAALSGEIVDRLPSFKSGTGSVELQGIQLALLLDNRVIRLRGTIGTVYILWLRQYNEISVNDQSSNVYENVPCIVEMNGQHSFQNMVVLTPDAGKRAKKLQSIDLHHIKLENDLEFPIFVREDDPRKTLAQEKPVVTKSTVDAMETVTSSGLERELVQDQHSSPLFDNNGDSDEEILIMAEGLQLRMDLTTPRHVKNDMHFSKSSDEEEEKT